MQVTYQFLPFKNEARKDDLELRHWVQCYKDASGQTRPKDDGPYQYSKLNVSAGTIRYDDAEYETVIRRRFPEDHSGWSRARSCVLSTNTAVLALFAHALGNAEACCLKSLWSEPTAEHFVRIALN